MLMLLYFSAEQYLHPPSFHFFFFNDTATTEIYTLSLHDALPISQTEVARQVHDRPDDLQVGAARSHTVHERAIDLDPLRSEEHTSELQSQSNLVCRLLLEKKKKDVHIRKIEHKS